MTQALAIKYRPKTIDDFIGLAKPKKLLKAYLARPLSIRFLFEGKSGSGKSTMAHVLAASIPAELHALAAHECTRERLARLWQTCHNAPRAGCKMHLVLVDQADCLTHPQQMDLRSKLVGSEALPNVVWVFTAIPRDTLEAGFRSRCILVPFSTYGNANEAAKFLERIWNAEATSPTEKLPNFARIVKEANGDLRTSLTVLDSMLMT